MLGTYPTKTPSCEDSSFNMAYRNPFPSIAWLLSDCIFHHIDERNVSNETVREPSYYCDSSGDCRGQGCLSVVQRTAEYDDWDHHYSTLLIISCLRTKTQAPQPISKLIEQLRFPNGFSRGAELTSPTCMVEGLSVGKHAITPRVSSLGWTRLGRRAALDLDGQHLFNTMVLLCNVFLLPRQTAADDHGSVRMI
ncbi:hypothetical protein P152DRAFT_344044 [Eremomyces bilateralis CBS 781.70]|uniref:Uncharacterized protein n=1 Tax=Eremomyces bilateralis CBS 781.70 TaxID=1392243 RepID=A0A6G1G3Q8_9PEZI|nr:uncharacterized protein P152DRAFT_344044 [Eremomyces bilateralis CBS 781.70]KAF1812612.1 hypothetical protein P152DRAFT_344044 [Eremomyces bilateralis CBS 781.70]